MAAPRLSAFTFESTVHSSHVLRRLEQQQRLGDSLCDVTVVAEGRSFKAHRCVLAACSSYFAQRLPSLSPQAAVLTLPPEVTVAGFEPLLKFAYTSKLHFRREDVMDIRHSAAVLGFQDLDEACYDFLLPKFFSSTKADAVFRLRKTCCREKCKRRLSEERLASRSDDAILDEKEVKPVADSCDKPAQSEAGHENFSGNVRPTAGYANDHLMQCPKYRRQMACEKEVCEKRRLAKDCLSLSHSPASGCAESGGGVGNSTLSGQSEEEEVSNGRFKVDVGLMKQEASKEQETCSDEETAGASHGQSSSWPSSAQGERSSRLILHHLTPLASAEDPALSGLTDDPDRPDMNVTEEEKRRSCGRTACQNEEDEREDEGMDSSWTEGGERSIVEREVAEHLAKRLGADVDVVSQEGNQDMGAGSSSGAGSRKTQSASTAEWADCRLNSRPVRGSCPFFQELDQGKCLWKGAELLGCEGTSQSGLSSLTSGEDGDSETEGDSESSARERARQMHLPFSVDWVVDLSRNDFQQLLKQQPFTQEQLEFVHDMRRRSKNRLAAQRCRKRKLDCIYNLQCEISKLKAEREKLIMEKNQLGQLKLKTCHSVSALCQKVCGEANLQPEQLQVLAKYTSPDCPLSSVFPHMNSLLLQFGQQHQQQQQAGQVSLSGSNDFLPLKEAVPASPDSRAATGEALL